MLVTCPLHDSPPNHTLVAPDLPVTQRAAYDEPPCSQMYSILFAISYSAVFLALQLLDNQIMRKEVLELFVYELRE